MINRPVPTSFCPLWGRWADSSFSFFFGGAEVTRKAEMTANEPKESEFESKALRQGGNYWSRGRDSDATLYVFSTPLRDSAPILSFQSCIIAFFFFFSTCHYCNTTF